MVESPQLPLKYYQKAGLDAIHRLDTDMKYRSSTSPPDLRFPSDDIGARSPIPSSSSIAPSSPLLDLRTPDPPSSPANERHGQHIASSPKSFWEVAFNYGPDFPYKPRMVGKAPSTHLFGGSFSSRQRSSSVNAPWLATDVGLSECSEDVDSDTLHSCDEIPLCLSDQVRIVNSEAATYMQGSEMRNVYPKYEDLERGEDDPLLENIDAATILLALSRQPRISSCSRSSFSAADSRGVSVNHPGKMRDPPSALRVAGADISTTSDLPQMTSPMDSSALISAQPEFVRALITTGTSEVKSDMNGSGECGPLSQAEQDDCNLQVSSNSWRTSEATALSNCNVKHVQSIPTAKPSVEEKGENEISSGSANIVQHENRGQSNDIISRPGIGDDKILDDPISAEIFSNSLTPLSTPVEAPSDLEKDEPAPVAPIMNSRHDLSSLPCPTPSLDARYDGEKENLPVNLDGLAAPVPVKPRSASVLGLAISVDRNEGKTESSEVGLRISASDITLGIANSVVGGRSRKRPLTPTGKSPSGSPTVPMCSETSQLPKKSRNRSTEKVKSDEALLSFDVTGRPRVASVPSDIAGSPLIGESGDINESAKMELYGCLIQAMTLSRASSMPASSLLRVVLRENPHLENQHTQESRLKVVEDVLKSHDVFGRIDRKGLDADDKPLEAQWFYIPEKDPDQERASLLREMMPKKRNETKKHKQYFFKLPGKISKWDTEDDI